MESVCGGACRAHAAAGERLGNEAMHCTHVGAAVVRATTGLARGAAVGGDALDVYAHLDARDGEGRPVNAHELKE